MQVNKEAETQAAGLVSGEDLTLIHKFSRKKLTAEEVYTFGVRLCDNEVDRDFERFATETLEELAALFVGKSGVFDHQWSAKGQTARIYRTELVREPALSTAAGDEYAYLKGYAYMLRTEGNAQLIAEIEGGIKKEVSVGCAVEGAICSICGGDMRDHGACSHVKGRSYGGKLCWGELKGATDAFEWSFVAVPAQKNAGVMKTLGREEKQMTEQMEKEAELGRKYLKGLRDEVARLGGLAEPGLAAETFKGIAEKLDEEELLALRKVYEQRLDGAYPPGTQLTYKTGKSEAEHGDGAFLI
ncbi:MAG: hypothetical protein RRY53_06545 [Pseudoflavonifractor sp.]